MARFLRIVPLLFLSCLTAYSQTGISVYDRIQEQREAFPLERVYVHTDAEDYLQGDRIWLKAYLMDEVDHTPVDSTLYVYAELFDKNGKMARQVKLLRREGAFYGYLDIPEDLLSGAAYLRAYTRYMAAAPETAFIKRIVVGRDAVREPNPDRPDGSLSVRRRQHGFVLSYPGKDLHYLLVLQGGAIRFLGSVGKGRTLPLPDGILSVVPLGYQRVVDFERADAYRNRRTVYWNPLLLSDTVSFRLGDTPGAYLVVLEGVTSEGRLVHEEIPFEVSQ